MFKRTQRRVTASFTFGWHCQFGERQTELSWGRSSLWDHFPLLLILSRWGSTGYQRILRKTRRRAFDLVLGALMLCRAAAAAPLLLAILYHIYTALYPSVMGRWSRGLQYINVQTEYRLFHYCALQGVSSWFLDECLLT